MRISRFPDLWRFLLISLAALACVAVTASLGFWQLGRAAQKQAVFDAITRQQALAPWHNAQLAAEVPLASESIGQAQQATLLHRPVQLQGQWLAEQTIFLDNRQMQGRAGFYVLTPFRLSAPHGHRVVVVQRGWAPRNFMDRALLPEVQTPSGLVSIEGRLEAPPSRLMELEAAHGGADPDEQKSRIRQNADIALWAQQGGLPLLALSVVQSGSASEGLLRDWPQINAGVQKHYGYAFQWFGLSVLVVLLYVWFQLVRRFYPRRRAAQPEG
ncbi:SURF1 family protein [Comamonas thiooxydans]|uniref:SURF1 family protein n=1 Tax=Comamonas thiooxydans TaxID=363952 RepID=UPI00050FC9FF|nr:SURF1 family protein [Comamonas thiooxydans]KGG89698.1 transmembrane cytochrome oxidase [Comamonas thiooxydans]